MYKGSARIQKWYYIELVLLSSPKFASRHLIIISREKINAREKVNANYSEMGQTTTDNYTRKIMWLNSMKRNKAIISQKNSCLWGKQNKPRHLLTIDDAEMLKKVVLHSVATAFASIVCKHYIHEKCLNEKIFRRDSQNENIQLDKIV